MKAIVLNETIRVISQEMTKSSRRSYDNDRINHQLESVASELSLDHVNELIDMFELDSPNIDGSVWHMA